jgi:hypothetical protein
MTRPADKSQWVRIAEQFEQSGLTQKLETICGRRGISIAASEIARAPATPRVLVSLRRYLVRRTAVTRIADPRFREIASSDEAKGRPYRDPRAGAFGHGCLG